jgi:biotin transport system substrate-specific component
MLRASSSSPTRTLAIRFALAVAGSVLLALSAKVAVPVEPVPITLQTLALPLLVLALGRNLAVLAAALYLAEGAIGLPVFASPIGGFALLIGPTAGYLWMYPVAAFVMGTLLDRGFKANWASRWAAVCAGDLVVFAGGVGWLMAAAHLTLAPALALGAAPFAIGDLLKITIASALPAQAAKIAGAFRI